MNKARRKVLSDLIERLDEILEALGTLSEEEQGGGEQWNRKPT